MCSVPVGRRLKRAPGSITTVVVAVSTMAGPVRSWPTGTDSSRQTRTGASPRPGR